MRIFVNYLLIITLSWRRGKENLGEGLQVAPFDGLEQVSRRRLW